MNDRIYYGSPDDEELTYNDPDEYVLSVLEQYLPGEALPETLIVARFEPMVINWKWYPETVLERLIEDLDDEHGPPDGTELTADMRTAAFLFVERIRRQYFPYSCEEVSREEINVEAWLKENRPEWLEDQERGVPF